MIVSLAAKRQLKLVLQKKAQLLSVLAKQREALEKLFSSGVIYHQLGSAAGRSLLQSQECLLNILDILEQCEQHTDTSAYSSSLVKEINRLPGYLLRSQKLVEQSTRKIQAINKNN